MLVEKGQRRQGKARAAFFTSIVCCIDRVSFIHILFTILFSSNWLFVLWTKIFLIKTIFLTNLINTAPSFKSHFDNMASGNPLTVDGELQYIVQWFSEWSELQRDDFLPIVSDFLASGNSTTLNGITSSLTGANLDDKPMSLFQCRVRELQIRDSNGGS